MTHRTSALQVIAGAALIGVGVVASADNQRSFRARGSAASRLAVHKSMRLDPDAASAAVPLREGEAAATGVWGGACSDPARSLLEQADGRRGSSSKR